MAALSQNRMCMLITAMMTRMLIMPQATISMILRTSSPTIPISSQPHIRSLGPLSTFLFQPRYFAHGKPLSLPGYKSPNNTD